MIIRKDKMDDFLSDNEVMYLADNITPILETYFREAHDKTVADWQRYGDVVFVQDPSMLSILKAECFYARCWN
jgi:hypothetical protein